MKKSLGHVAAGVAAALIIPLTVGLPLAPSRAVAATAAAPASDPRSPEAIVMQVYQRLIAAEKTSKGYTPPETMYSPRLKALVAAARRQAKGEAACGLDFIFWFNGQDDQIRGLKVTRGPTTADDRTTVTAIFTNTGDPEKIIFDFQKLSGRWMLNDAHSVVGDTQWTFSRLLQCKD